MRRLAILLILILASAAHGAYETGGVQKTILANGLTLLVRPEPEARVAVIEVFVRVGAEDEQSPGIGHLLAGSMLAGTTTHSLPKLARMVTEAGGNFHAEWQWNYIEIYAVTLPDKCGEGISLVSDSIKNSRLDPAAVEYARSSLLRGMRRSTDDPFDSAYTALRKLVHRGTPYGRAFLGDEAAVLKIDRASLDDFYRRNISPSRMVVCVVGNVDPDAVRRQVEANFKSMAPSAGRKTNVENGTAEETKIELEKASPVTYIMLGFPAPGVESADYAPMCVANVLLGGNKSSLLFTKLREERGLGYQVGSRYPEMRGASHLAAYLSIDSARATPETLQTVEDAMLEQVRALTAGEWSDDDLARAKGYLIGRHALTHERVRDRAFRLGWSEIMGLGYQYDFSGYTESIRRVSREDVLRACKRYLTAPSIVVSR
ncbi:MAG: M16 family metallopeptidase [Armatimonadota bacterium]